MDFFFRLQIPRSAPGSFIIRPQGKTFITGIASSYKDDQYDELILGNYISEAAYKELLKTINLTMNTYWPCSCTIWFGYLLAPFTFGISFLLPNLCISDAKIGLIATIERQNRIKLREKGLVLRYVQGWSMAWLELSVIGKGGGGETAR